MPKRKKRRILRQGEDSYRRPADPLLNCPDGDARFWEFDRVDETTEEACEVCEKVTQQIFCLSSTDDGFEEKRVCSMCAETLVKEPDQVRQLNEELGNAGTVTENHERFQELWDGAPWRRTPTPGNQHKTVAGIYVLVFQARRGPHIGQWSHRIGEKWAGKSFPNRDSAQRDAFTAARLQYMTNRSNRAMQRRDDRRWEEGQPLVTRIHDSVTIDVPPPPAENGPDLDEWRRRLSDAMGRAVPEDFVIGLRERGLLRGGTEGVPDRPTLDEIFNVPRQGEQEEQETDG
jgi:hypothetical protein